MRKPSLHPYLLASAMSALAGLSTMQPAEAATVRYDVDNGALAVNTGGFPLDQFSSGAFSIGSHTFSPTVPNTFRPFQLDIQFWDAQTNAPQTMTLKTEGLGGAQMAPTTFGSLSTPLGGHSFGPSMILSNATTDLNVFTVANARIEPWVKSGTLAGDFIGTGGSVCGHGPDNDCDFGVRFPDMVDGPGALELSGFTVNFQLGVAEPTTFNTFEFNLISPSIGTATAPIPEPSTGALMLAGLLGLIAFARRRLA